MSHDFVTIDHQPDDKYCQCRERVKGDQETKGEKSGERQSAPKGNDSIQTIESAVDRKMFFKT